jgi:hypothetical protein
MMMPMSECYHTHNKWIEQYNKMVFFFAFVCYFPGFCGCCNRSTTTKSSGKCCIQNVNTSTCNLYWLWVPTRAGSALVVKQSFLWCHIKCKWNHILYLQLLLRIHCMWRLALILIQPTYSKMGWSWPHVEDSEKRKMPSRGRSYFDQVSIHWSHNV